MPPVADGGEPYGAVPTTHIIKPAVTGFDEHDLNEHLCPRAARALGLDTVSSSVMAFDGERAIVVERYDRISRPDGVLVRVHAPLYDIASALPYDDMYLPKLKMAMRIGGEYVINNIERRHWRRLGEAVGFDPDRTLHRVDEIAAHVGDAFAAVAVPMR